MDTKRFIVVLAAILLASVVVVWAGVQNGITYTDYNHAAIKIGDGKNTNLSGTTIGFGNVADVTCIQNCSGFVNGSGSNLSLSGNLTATIIGGVVQASAFTTLQAAVNASDTNNDNTSEYPVFVSGGLYNFSSLWLLNNTELYGRETTILNVSSAPTVLFGVQGAAIYTRNWNDAGDSNIFIHDLTIRANNLTECIAMLRANNLTIERVTCSDSRGVAGIEINPDHGRTNVFMKIKDNRVLNTHLDSNAAYGHGYFITAKDTNNLEVSGNYAIGGANNGFELDDNPQNANIHDNYALNNTGSGYQLTDLHDGNFVSNYAYNNTGYGLLLSQTTRNMTIHGNNFRWNTQNDIYSDTAGAWSFNIITDNYVAGKTTAIRMKTSGNIVALNTINASTAFQDNEGNGNNTFFNNFLINVTTLTTGKGQNSVYRDNFGFSPYNFGSFDRAAGQTNFSAFGKGDMFENITSTGAVTKNDLCISTAAGQNNWVFAGNRSGSC